MSSILFAKTPVLGREIGLFNDRDSGLCSRFFREGSVLLSFEITFLKSVKSVISY
jgi:hypothetical protein